MHSLEASTGTSSYHEGTKIDKPQHEEHEEGVNTKDTKDTKCTHHGLIWQVGGAWEGVRGSQFAVRG
jgi:hypothetical protein